MISTHAPAGGATQPSRPIRPPAFYFYSRPCGRGDLRRDPDDSSTSRFLLTPLREGRPESRVSVGARRHYFYSRPCGRGDGDPVNVWAMFKFLLTPLREGRRKESSASDMMFAFLLTPLREGRQRKRIWRQKHLGNFYSRPCGRGDRRMSLMQKSSKQFLLTPLREGRRQGSFRHLFCSQISTHAPAGGATSASSAEITMYGISTHAPAGGATESSRPAFCAPVFLLTPLREGRQQFSTSPS